MALRLAPRLVAADGGAVACLAAGLVPEAVIGDMDSLPAAASARLEGRIHRIDEQETTDFDKALRNVAAPVVLALGVTGGRWDHELAVLHSLMVHADRPCVVLGAESLAFLCPPRIELHLSKGDGVSLFPLREVEVASDGLVWPTEGLTFAPGGRIGTSNAAAGGGPVRLAADRPAMLVILSRQAVAEAVRALAAPDAGRWPARAG